MPSSMPSSPETHPSAKPILTYDPTTPTTTPASAATSDKHLYLAVQTRNPVYDTAFVYCVRTTKIFCRPTCKARLARRANILFLPDAEAARAAGYRACKRCRPDLAPVPFEPEAEKIRRVREALREWPSNKPLPGLKEMADMAGLTRWYFHRAFKREVGVTPREFAMAARHSSDGACIDGAAAAAQEERDDSASASVPELSELLDIDLSIPLPRPFSPDYEAAAAPVIGATQPGAVETVYFTLLQTKFGRLLVAFQELEMCRIEIGASDDELLLKLADSFSLADYACCPVEVAGPEEAELMMRRAQAVLEGMDGLDPMLDPTFDASYVDPACDET